MCLILPLKLASSTFCLSHPKSLSRTQVTGRYISGKGGKHMLRIQTFCSVPELIKEQILWMLLDEPTVRGSCGRRRVYRFHGSQVGGGRMPPIGQGVGKSLGLDDYYSFPQTQLLVGSRACLIYWTSAESRCKRKGARVWLKRQAGH